jgi:hypothetical protein
VPRPPEQTWVDRALDVLPEFVAAQGAIVWPEAIAHLSEGTWIRVHRPDAGYSRLDPHILGRARTELLDDGVLIEDTRVLNQRAVSVFLDGPGLASRRTSQIREAASAKRRLYRSFLGWTGHSELCGHVAESAVEATMGSLAGTDLWLPPDAQRGRVGTLLGRPVAGGPLDAAGFVPNNALDPAAGWVPFAVEVKNVRSWIYPWSHEVWDLLAKLGDFPDVVPLLVARRIHPTTFRMFKDLGAFGYDARKQWFAERGGGRSIDQDDFERVTSRLGFEDAVLLSRPPGVERGLANLLSNVFHRPHGELDVPLIQAAAARWREAAPLAADFVDLRAERMNGDERRELLTDFAARVYDADLMSVGGWARLPDEYYEDEPDEDDYPDEYYEPE